MAAVVGRDRELDLVQAFLAAGPGGHVLLLEGDAGIGKTTLWRASVELAAVRGLRILRCSAVEAETQLAFTGIRDLLGEPFDEAAGALADPQRRALAVTLLREEPPERPLEPGAIAVAFLETLRLLGSRSPLLVAVDDVQWLDPASAGVLRYAVRRIAQPSASFLFARRTGGADALELARLDPGAVRTLELGPLSMGALGHVLHERLGKTYPRPLLQRIVQASGGNAFFAVELGRALGDRVDVLAPGAPLPVPRTVRELVGARLESLPPRTLDALSCAAALSRAAIDIVSAAVGQEASPLVEPAVAAHVVELDGDAIRFAHPLFAAAAYEAATPARRKEIHARLAVVLQDVEERARHLALAQDEPSRETAAVLESAALSTRVRGDRVVSAALFAAAARLTPTDDADARARRMLAGAGALFEAGDSDRARELLEQVVRDLGASRPAAEARWRLGTVLAETGSLEAAMALWREALAGTADPTLISEVRRSMAVATIYAGDAVGALADADASVAAAEASGDAEQLAFALSTRALAAAVTGDPGYRGLVARALALEETVGGLASAAWTPSAVAAECARHALDLAEAERLFPSVLEQALQAGNAEMELWASYGLAAIRLAAGEPSSARELAAVALDLAETTGVMHLPARRLWAEIDAHVGLMDEARERLADVAEESLRAGWQRHLWQARVALGALHLSAGDAAAAAAELLEARRLAEDHGMRHAASLCPLVDEAEAAARAGRFEQAAQALAAARSFVEPPVWAEPMQLRGEAALRAARGELAGADRARTRARAPRRHGAPAPARADAARARDRPATAAAAPLGTGHAAAGARGLRRDRGASLGVAGPRRAGAHRRARALGR